MIHSSLSIRDIAAELSCSITSFEQTVRSQQFIANYICLSAGSLLERPIITSHIIILLRLFPQCLVRDIHKFAPVDLWQQFDFLKQFDEVLPALGCQNKWKTWIDTFVNHIRCPRWNEWINESHLSSEQLPSLLKILLRLKLCCQLLFFSIKENKSKFNTNNNYFKIK